MITQSLASASAPAGRRIYVVGDVHGCADRLAEMHRLIRADLAARPVGEATLAHLGDLIDRGPDSAKVVALLLEPWPGPLAPRMINLLGNHEEMMLDAIALGDPRSARLWLDNGGAETLKSWGISHRSPSASWWDAIPPRHLGFLRGLRLMHRCGGYVLVHAGIRPDRPLERQVRGDLLWIREPFLSWAGTPSKVVVHGHTPEQQPTLTSLRIGVDTGAVLGGALTCAVLEADTVAFIQC